MRTFKNQGFQIISEAKESIFKKKQKPLFKAPVWTTTIELIGMIIVYWKCTQQKNIYTSK